MGATQDLQNKAHARDEFIPSFRVDERKTKKGLSVDQHVEIIERKENENERMKEEGEKE